MPKFQGCGDKMELIRSVTAAFCFVGLAATIFDYISPSESLRLNIKQILALILTISMLTPFLGSDLELRLPKLNEITDLKEYNELNESVNKSYEKVLKNTLENRVLERLQAIDENIKKVVIQADVHEYNSLEVEKTELYIKAKDISEEKKKKIEEELKNNIGESKAEFYEYKE